MTHTGHEAQAPSAADRAAAEDSSTREPDTEAQPTSAPGRPAVPPTASTATTSTTSTTASTTSATPPTVYAAPPRRAYRRLDRRWLGGVCGGLADHLGIGVNVVRLAFVAITVLTSGMGVLVYGALWFLMPGPGTRPAGTRSPGLDAQTRAGSRPNGTPGAGVRNGAAGPAGRRRRRGDELPQAIAVLALGGGMVLLAQATNLGVSSKIFWPLVFAVAGVALIWRQADDAQRAEWQRSSRRFPALFAVLGPGRLAVIVRLVLGVALLGGAVTTVLAQSGRIVLLKDVMVALLLALVGVAVMVAPFIQRMARDLNGERNERIRTQERADMAAHLHDSVLQTLALIQKQADDPKQVSKLARAQERDLRTWLYGEQKPDETMTGAIRRAAAEVEDQFSVPVEVVTVADCDLDDSLQAMVQAAREAMVNAAKHSEAEKIDVFSEVDGAHVEVFVRDRGKGFDDSTIPEDRLGVRHSVIGRMERHGGTARIRSTPGEGTEVRLEMDR